MGQERKFSHQLNKWFSLILVDYLTIQAFMFSILSSYQGYGSHKVISSFPIIIQSAYQLTEACQYPTVLLWIWWSTSKSPVQSLHTLFVHVISQVGGGHDGLVHGIDHLVIEWFPFIVIQKNLHGSFNLTARWANLLLSHWSFPKTSL